MSSTSSGALKIVTPLMTDLIGQFCDIVEGNLPRNWSKIGSESTCIFNQESLYFEAESQVCNKHLYWCNPKKKR
jgi:hypothetical protein